MARSVTEITRALRDDLKSVDPSIDTEVGPVWNFLLAPIPTQLATIENDQERILRFFSTSFPLVATPEEARDFANNFGLAASPGGRAFCPIVFFRNSAVPVGRTAIIPVGIILTSVDGSLVYRTVESKTMFGDFAQSYYNPSTNKYEILVMVEAINPGILYNVPPFRITKVVSGQVPFDGVLQRVQARGGSEPENSYDLLTRTIDQFKGLNLGSQTGIANLAQNIEGTSIFDQRIVRPTDRLEFRRPAPGPALDLCVSGFEFSEFSEEYFSVGGETTIPLTANRTVESLIGVQVNSIALDDTEWTLVKDTSLAWRGSTRARPSVQLTSPLATNDVVVISGIKNILLDKVQAFFTDQTNALFKTDILVRAFVELPIVVTVDVKLSANSSVDLTVANSQISDIVATFIEPEVVPGSLEAPLLDFEIRSSIPEVESVKISQFRRRDKSLADIEVVVPLKNEIPVFDSVLSSLVVRT